MGFNGLKTVRERLIEIETEKSKVEEWGSGSSRVKYRTLQDLNKEYRELNNMITSDADLDKSITELKIRANNSNRKVYAIQ